MRLREIDIIAIRQANESGTSQAELAKQYDVQPATISKIVRRKTWADTK